MTIRSRRRLHAAVVLMVMVFWAPLPAETQDTRLARAELGPQGGEQLQKVGLDDLALIHVERLTPAEALDVLRDRTGVRILFSPSLLPDNMEVNCDCSGLTIREALNTILQDTGFGFTQVRGHILVQPDRAGNSEAEEAVQTLPAMLWQRDLAKPAPSIRPMANPLPLLQTGVVAGQVMDGATMRPLETAQVHITGTGLGALTDQQGRFRIENVPAGEVVVRVEMLGYRSAEQVLVVPPGEIVTVSIQLAVSVIQLEELVAVGYGERRRREISSSISSVHSDRLANIPQANMEGIIQGKAAGVHVVQNAGNPGGGITVRVRGSSSVSASNQPLWVIDGVPMFHEDFSQLGMGGQNLSAVTGISPNDIESIDILKDAAATALYGSRGSNGVVMIRTRRGVQGAPRFTLNTYFGVQDTPKRLELLNSTEYITIFNESATNDRYRENMYGVIGVDDRISTDWQDALFRTGPVQSTELSVSGGLEQVSYHLSANYFDQAGVVVGSGYGRANVRANVDVIAGDRLSLSSSLGFTWERIDRVPGDQSFRGVVPMTVAAQPMFPVRLEDGSFQGRGSGFPPDGLQYPNGIALATLDDVEVINRRALGNVEGRLKLAESLRLTSRAGFDILTMREEQWESPLVEGTYAAGADGVAKRGYSAGDRFVLDNYLSFEPSLAGRHGVTVTAGGTVEMTKRELNFVRGEGFSNDYFTQVRNAANIVEGDATKREHNLVGVFSRLDYSLDGRYLFTGNFRADGSSRFGPTNRWGFFPAGSFAWLVSDEAFFPSGGLVEDLRIRISAGITGNQAISDYPHQGLFATANYGDAPGLAPGSLGNPELKWETTREFNVGVDASFLDGRVGVVADLYVKRTEDLLLSRPITSTTGFTTIFSNVGEIENRGLELRINTINVEGRAPGAFEWASDFNVSFNRNEVLALYDDEPFNAGIRSVNRVEVGEPLGAFHMRRFLGVDPETGNAMFSEDREIVGSPHPDFTGGLTNRMRWRGFDMLVFMQFSYGAEIFNAMRLFADAGGWYLDNQFRHVLRRWQQPGDVTDVPRMSYNGTSGSREVSSRFVEDASYLRIQEVNLGYELPTVLVRPLGVESARLYIAAHNLHTFTRYMGYIPEANSPGSGANIALGTDFYVYPIPRSLTFGVRASW